MIDLLINFDNEEDKRKLFGIIKHLKGNHSVGIRKYRAKRSSPQNRYYWGVVLAYLAEETGYTKDEVHQLMQRRFLRYTKDVFDGSEEFVKSTTSLNTIEMQEYIDQISIFAISELGVYIPQPNEIAYEA
jgi:hypothetical protein